MDPSMTDILYRPLQDRTHVVVDVLIRHLERDGQLVLHLKELEIASLLCQPDEGVLRLAQVPQLADRLSQENI